MFSRPSPCPRAGAGCHGRGRQMAGWCCLTTPWPCRPGCPPELSRPAFSPRTGARPSPPFSHPRPPPGSAEGPLWGQGPGDGVPVPAGGEDQGVGSRCQRGGARPLCTEVGEPVVGSLRHTGRGTEEKGALRLLGSAPRAGAESPWEVPQPCEQSPNLKPAPPCRCLCTCLIFKLEKQLKELGDCAALERA